LFEFFASVAPSVHSAPVEVRNGTTVACSSTPLFESVPTLLATTEWAALATPRITPVVCSSYSVRSRASRFRRNDTEPPASRDVVISGARLGLADTVADESIGGTKMLVKRSGGTAPPTRDRPACTTAELKLSLTTPAARARSIRPAIDG